MNCFSPTSIRNPSIISKSVRLTIPCGKCAACLTNKRNDWATRLRFETRYSTSGHFLTLTYSDQNIITNDIPNIYGEIIYQQPTLVKKDVQLFMKRLRKGLPEKLRYFAVGEYGTKTKRPHYHMLLFNIKKYGLDLERELLQKWDKGIVHIGTVKPGSIKYCTNYIIQKHNFQNPFIQKPFNLMSQGLGKQYIEKNLSRHQQDLSRSYITFEDGQKSRMPRYYKDKIYTKIQKEQIAKNQIQQSDERFKEKTLEHETKNPSRNRFLYETEQNTQYEFQQAKIQATKTKI